jgi:hypothetical protein
MFMKILATSALTIGLATSAMAQSADYRTDHHWWPFNNDQGIDTSTTGSIYGDGSGLAVQGNPGPTGPWGLKHSRPGREFRPECERSILRQVSPATAS